MTLTTLDAIVRNCLMKRHYSIHYWIDFMVYAKDCLRELTLNELHVINTKRLPVDQEFNTVELPSDFQDHVGVYVMAGQNLRPLTETDKINPLVNRDASANPIRYDALANIANPPLLYGTQYPFYWRTTTWNEFGESTGRLFGYGAGSQNDVYAVFRERNQIQLSELLSVTEIILRHISDGMNVDAATQIDVYAYATIDAYCMWQHKEHLRYYSVSERQLAKQEYIGERQKLRAIKSDLTPEKLRRIIQRATYAAPKSS